MGLDITYHPISEDEMRKWYFDRLFEVRNGNDTGVGAQIKQSGIKDDDVTHYIRLIDDGAKIPDNISFQKTHGFCLAAIQGIFRKYFYTRATSFSLLTNIFPDLNKFVKNWEEIIPPYIKCKVDTEVEAFSAGVFIPYNKIMAFGYEFQENPALKNIILKYYSNDTIEAFIKAINFCVENRLGLLEARDVISVNPINLNQTESYTKLINCDNEGAIYYAKSSLLQIKEYEEKNNMKQGEVLESGMDYQKLILDIGEQKITDARFESLLGK